VQANSEAAKNDQLSENQLLGQMNTFIFAGQETTSGALARVLHLLSMDQTMQDRLRAELQAAPSDLDYNELHSLEYLDVICREVLRLYPPVATVERDTLKDWVVPLQYPIKGIDGRLIREVEVKKGTTIVVSFREANRCKGTRGEDADEFRPERWLKNLSSSAAEAKTPGIYSSMMTFSGGPRACIGFRFSILELKSILSMLVRSFRFTPASTAIEWRLGRTMIPYQVGTKAKDLQPRLPLRVTLL
ncbi:cytochrome P450, partial [Ceratobasidium sp. AG-I]